MIFPLLRTWFKPIFGSAFSSAKTSYKHPSGFRTIGGHEHGTGMSSRRRMTASASAKNSGANTTLSLTESEERIVKDVKLQTLNVYATSDADDKVAKPKGIVVSSEFEITEDRASQHGGQKAQRAHEPW